MRGRDHGLLAAPLLPSGDADGADVMPYDAKSEGRHWCNAGRSDFGSHRHQDEQPHATRYDFGTASGCFDVTLLEATWAVSRKARNHAAHVVHGNQRSFSLKALRFLRSKARQWFNIDTADGVYQLIMEDVRDLAATYDSKLDDLAQKQTSLDSLLMGRVAGVQVRQQEQLAHLRNSASDQQGQQGRLRDDVGELQQRAQELERHVVDLTAALTASQQHVEQLNSLWSENLPFIRDRLISMDRAKSEEIPAVSVEIAAKCQQLDSSYQACSQQLAELAKEMEQLRRCPVRPGCLVRLLGLERSPSLNGQIGEVIQYDSDKSRWQVELDDGSVKLFREANLQVVCEQGSLSTDAQTADLEDRVNERLDAIEAVVAQLSRPAQPPTTTPPGPPQQVHDTSQQTTGKQPAHLVAMDETAADATHLHLLEQRLLIAEAAVRQLEACLGAASPPPKLQRQPNTSSPTRRRRRRSTLPPFGPTLASNGAGVFVGNVDFATTADDLRQLFGAAGAVAKVVLHHDRNTHRPKGSAWVFFDRLGSAAAALELAGASHRGRALRVFPFSLRGEAVTC